MKKNPISIFSVLLGFVMIKPIKTETRYASNFDKEHLYYYFHHINIEFTISYKIYLNILFEVIYKFKKFFA